MHKLNTLYRLIKSTYAEIIRRDRDELHAADLEKAGKIPANGAQRAYIRSLDVAALNRWKDEYKQRGGRRDLSRFTVPAPALKRATITETGRADFPYNVQLHTSTDGGQTWNYCGVGRYCKTRLDAEQQAAIYSE